jgi:glyoxylase-like metal-dependent hydrolase (beta-lactamase superfamily II)
MQSLKRLTAVLQLCLLAALTYGSMVRAETPNSAPTRLYVLDCGYLSFPDISIFGLTNDDTDVREMFVPCYLLEHKGSRLLWDAGLPLNAVGQGDIELIPGSGAIMRYEHSLIDQLAAIGVGVEDVEYLVLSHLHFDHAGAANTFKESTWIVQKAERDAGFGPQDPNNPAFDVTLFSELKTSKTIELDGDHDIYGDGVAKIISAPGHTPGHQVLLIDLPETGKILLGGDLYHFRATLRLRATPVFNFDRDQTLESMARVEEVVESTGATLWIEHDMALARTLRKSPAYYE